MVEHSRVDPLERHLDPRFGGVARDHRLAVCLVGPERRVLGQCFLCGDVGVDPPERGDPPSVLHADFPRVGHRAEMARGEHVDALRLIKVEERPVGQKTPRQPRDRLRHGAADDLFHGRAPLSPL